MRQAARGYPCVVDRAGTAAEVGVGLDLAPLDGDGLVVGEYDDLMAPVLEGG